MLPTLRELVVGGGLIGGRRKDTDEHMLPSQPRDAGDGMTRDGVVTPRSRRRYQCAGGRVGTREPPDGHRDDPVMTNRPVGHPDLGVIGSDPDEGAGGYCQRVQPVPVGLRLGGDRRAPVAEQWSAAQVLAEPGLRE